MRMLQLSSEYPVAAEEIMSLMVDAVVVICVLLCDWRRV